MTLSQMRRIGRIKELERDGYVTRHGAACASVFILTEKGWAVLSALAERPVEKPKAEPELKR
jgi:CTP-dependent riboflavin kinase